MAHACPSFPIRANRLAVCIYAGVQGVFFREVFTRTTVLTLACVKTRGQGAGKGGEFSAALAFRALIAGIVAWQDGTRVAMGTTARPTVRATARPTVRATARPTVVIATSADHPRGQSQT